MHSSVRTKIAEDGKIDISESTLCLHPAKLKHWESGRTPEPTENLKIGGPIWIWVGRGPKKAT